MANGIIVCGGYSNWGDTDPKEIQKMVKTQKEFEKTVSDPKLGYKFQDEFSFDYNTAIFGLACLMLEATIRKMNGHQVDEENTSNFCNEMVPKACCRVPVFGK